MAISWVRFLSCASSSSVDDAFCRRVTPISPLLPPCRRGSRREGTRPGGWWRLYFASTWSQTGATAPGDREALQGPPPPRAVAGFEEYLEAVRSRAGKQDPRCAADGNEMMRFHYCPAGGVNETMHFHCCSPAGGGNDETMCFRCCAHRRRQRRDGALPLRLSQRRRHADVGGDRHGPRERRWWGQRRAMAVCRVIAAAWGAASGSPGSSTPLPGWGAVGLRPRAVLPCFLIIYRV
ncbi:unnamed protein product [Spirodela intermedia]|uniref:Uncharacterized protein n=1 Tax=Spirodela intermedia TaxID=51605 RepID=A0A7I8JTS9_SPIIN|nr:unnamed protein product [Spirodela intermedia]CAA6673578.1 unnamed protein product [Spirodela intermedia]